MLIKFDGYLVGGKKTGFHDVSVGVFGIEQALVIGAESHGYGAFAFAGILDLDDISQVQNSPYPQPGFFLDFACNGDRNGFPRLDHPPRQGVAYLTPTAPVVGYQQDPPLLVHQDGRSHQ